MSMVIFGQNQPKILVFQSPTEYFSNSATRLVTPKHQSYQCKRPNSVDVILQDR